MLVVLRVKEIPCGSPRGIIVFIGKSSRDNENSNVTFALIQETDFCILIVSDRYFGYFVGNIAEMKITTSLFGLLLPVFLPSESIGQENSWFKKTLPAFDINYTISDTPNIEVYSKLVVNGIAATEKFFDSSLSNRFQVVIHPSRKSLDSTWEKEWQLANVKSECWMVASGVANRMDVIAPMRWDELACEHRYADSVATQHLITHEIVHVFHTQLNASPDFSETENLDWFVEGLATYVSGQMDAKRLSDLNKGLADKSIPASLDEFWTGNLKYSLSGSIVMYIEKTYGLNKLKELLPLAKKDEILSSLGVSENELLTAWHNYMGDREGH